MEQTGTAMKHGENSTAPPHEPSKGVPAVGWNEIGRLLRTMFLLRIPIFVLLILAALGPVALFSSFETLLGNLFDLRVVAWNANDTQFVVSLRWTALHVFLVSWAAFMLAWAAVTTINLVLIYGTERFDDRALNLGQKRPLLTFATGFLAALLFVVCVAFDTWKQGNSKLDLLIASMSLMGLATSLVLVALAKIVQLVFTDPITTPHPPPYLVFPAYIFSGLEKFFDELYCWRSGKVDRLKRALNGLSQWPLEIFRCAGQGYLIDRNASPGSLALQSGHVFALASAVLTTIIYLITGYAKGNINEQPSKVPALAFVLLFFTVACWTLSAFTFFFDRYRFPLLGTLAVLSLATTFSPQSDHFYRIAKGHPPEKTLLAPSELVRDRYQRGHKRLVLVATAGGGIQAAAWTTTVLEELQKECNLLPTKCDLPSSVAVISGVSGGSLGAMAYARAFVQPPPGTMLPGNSSNVGHADVERNAMTSAIDEVAWASTSPDLFRIVVPWFRRKWIDRGWALEERWAAINRLYYFDQKPKRSWFSAAMELLDLREENPRHDWFLSDWAPQPGRDTPALMLNATMVETGRPLVFSNSAFPALTENGLGNDRRGLVNFYNLYRSDIRVNSAARLSASFPYVAPAARSDASPPAMSDYHIVDGGYYDNFGVSSLLGWMENAINDRSSRSSSDGEKPALDNCELDDEVGCAFRNVLIVEIRSFPAAAESKGSVHGWGFQLTAPVDALLDVRDSGQLRHDDTELALFAEEYRNKRINVWRADFVFPQFSKSSGCGEAPLSWKLSLDQTTCLRLGWNKIRQGKPADQTMNPEIGCVLNYLLGKPVTKYQDGEQDPAYAYCRPGDNPNVYKAR